MKVRFFRLNNFSINNLNLKIMEAYNYLESVKVDVKNYIENEVELSDYSSREELESYLNDELFTNDSVTGNASGSYTYSTWQAEENLCHNLDLLGEACEEFGSSMDVIKNGTESCDVTIRCYLLNQAISEVLDEMESNEELN